jgi:hypothetical protein
LIEILKKRPWFLPGASNQKKVLLNSFIIKQAIVSRAPVSTGAIIKKFSMNRFLNKIIIVESGCWEWQAGMRGTTGYGAFKHEGKVIDAHRFSYELHKGKIPAGMLVCHKCDNRKCVNPDHLIFGIAQGQYQDAVNKGRIDFINRNQNLQNTHRLAHMIGAAVVMVVWS